MWNKRRVRPNEFYGDCRVLDQSALTPANFTTLPHFSVSSTISLPKSLGERQRDVARVRQAAPSSWVSDACIDLLVGVVISTGVSLARPRQTAACLVARHEFGHGRVSGSASSAARWSPPARSVCRVLTYSSTLPWCRM